jgi:hypothetical protein
MTLIIFFNDSPIGILNYHSLCVVNLPVGKPPKGLFVRSRYPQGNRTCDYAYQAVMVPYASGLSHDYGRGDMPKPREAALRLVSGKLLL